MKVNRIATIAAAVLTLLVVPAVAKSKRPMADEFTAVFISMNAPGAMGKPVQIWIESYTPDDVAESLMTTLQTKGQVALVHALPDTRAGTIRIGTSDGYPISIARQRTTENGRMVIMASNRPFVGIAQGGVAAVDSPIGYIQLNLKADGTGEGTIIGAAEVVVDANRNLTIKSEAVQPGRLSDVKTKKKESK